MSSEGASAPGAGLVELDRLLRDIQAELLPERTPAPALEDAPAPATPTDRPPAATPGPDPELQTRSELSARLLASTRELLAGYERVLVGPAAPPPAQRPARRRPASPDLTVSAAPFRSLDALREFEQAVAHLPGVREVAVQGYEGADRAIIEVRLDPPR